MNNNLIIETQPNGNGDLSDFQKKIYDEKSMCVFLKYLTDRKWAEFNKDSESEKEKHANHKVIQKNIETLAKMDPNDFTEKNRGFYNLSESYKVIILSRIFEFQNDENQKFAIAKSLDKNMNEMWTKYKKYPVGVFENILRLRFENIIKSFDKNEDNNQHQDFSSRGDLANAIKQFLGKGDLRAETRCLLWEYYAYFSAQENTISDMKSKSDFVDAINVIRGQRIENQVEERVEVRIVGGDENYKSISDAKEKDAFLSGVLKACGNHKWNFDNTKLSSLSNSEQKIIIPHLKGFICPTDRCGISRVEKKFATVADITNFILDGKPEESKEDHLRYYRAIFTAALSDLISMFCFLFAKAVSEMNDARIKILGVNTFKGIFNNIGIATWLDNICKAGGRNLGNIPDFAVAELVYTACNDDSYDFSIDIDFSGQKSKKEKDKDLEIENLLNFLVDQNKQKTIADFNSKQKRIYRPASNAMLRNLKIQMGVVVFLVLGCVAFSLWLLSLISITFCFVELGSFVFYHITNFIAKHLSEDNRIGKIIKHKYMRCFLIFLQLHILLLSSVAYMGVMILPCCIICFSYCTAYCIYICCPSNSPGGRQNQIRDNLEPPGNAQDFPNRDDRV